MLSVRTCCSGGRTAYKVGVLALFVIVVGTFIMAGVGAFDADALATVENIKLSKLIIDTDAGADDAIAIILAVQEAAQHPDVEIVAITCVHGNTHLSNVEINVLKTLRTVDASHIPVYSGANSSILKTPSTNNYFGVDGLGDFEFINPPTRNEIQKEHAVNAMIRLVKENPGEITILAIGPLTNIALAMRMDPSFRRNLRDLVILGGSLTNHGNVVPNAEFNFYMDPEANYIVLNSPESSEAKPAILVPFETVDLHATITKEWRKNVLGVIKSPLVEFINKAESVSLLDQSYDIWHVADCMPSAAVFRPGFIKAARQYHVEAIVDAGEYRGALKVLSPTGTRPSNVIAIENFDIEQYKNLFITHFG